MQPLDVEEKKEEKKEEVKVGADLETEAAETRPTSGKKKKKKKKKKSAMNVDQADSNSD